MVLGEKWAPIKRLENNRPDAAFYCVHALAYSDDMYFANLRDSSKLFINSILFMFLIIF